MSQPVLYIAITNHGFGHAVRSATVADAIKKLCPEILLILVTTAPRWLLDSYIEADFIYRPIAMDLGVVQSDSLKMDKAATKEKIESLRARQNSIIAGEVNFIRNNQVGLILADIPPLASLIAKAAGIPCWMMSNFGWDLIYRDWQAEFKDIVDWVSSCYEKCDRLYRFPLYEPMSAFSNIIDVGLTGGNPRYSAEELKANFNIVAATEKTILLTFGGLGLEAIPYYNLEKFPDWQFITFDRQAPELANLIKITDYKYRPVDFMPICGRVVSKPGYSTFAEAMRVGTPIVSLTRDDFAESFYLLEGIKDYAVHQIITPEEFFTGNWEFLEQNLQPARKDTSLAKDGAKTIAKATVEYLTA